MFSDLIAKYVSKRFCNNKDMRDSYIKIKQISIWTENRSKKYRNSKIIIYGYATRLFY